MFEMELNNSSLLNLLGERDENLKYIGTLLNVKVSVFGDKLYISDGIDFNLAVELFRELSSVALERKLSATDIVQTHRRLSEVLQPKYTKQDSENLDKSQAGTSKSKLSQNKLGQTGYSSFFDKGESKRKTNSKNKSSIEKTNSLQDDTHSVAGNNNGETQMDNNGKIMLSGGTSLSSTKLEVPKRGEFKTGYIYPKTESQVEFIKAINDNSINFGIGTAGSGKTFIAAACGVHYLSKGVYNKLVLVRPAVEAGEVLGFLPGDMKEKVLPYLAPVTDVLTSILGKERLEMLVEKGIIEMAPIAFMRGRTLENSFIIVDEAQNATKLQMKMILTRLGIHSKMVITGDATQIDLPRKVESGLLHAVNILSDVNGISVTRFSESDNVRNTLVEKVLRAYGADEMA